MSLTIIYPQRVCLSGNPVEVMIETSTTNVSNHKIHLAISFDNFNTTFVELQLQVINGKSIFNISEFLKKEYFNQFNYSDFVNLITQKNIVDTYKIRFWETYNNNHIIYNSTTSSSFFYIQAGIDDNLLSYFSSENTNFYSEFISSGKFLTWQPNNKKVLISEIDKLYFYSLSNYFVAKLNVIITKQNSVETKIFSKNLSADKIYEINSGPGNILLTELTDNRILYYDIFLTNSTGTKISETRRYYIDRNFYNNIKYFIFKNSLGCYDCFKTTGITEVNSNYTSDFVDNAKKVNSTKTTTYKTNTGHLNYFNSNALDLNNYFDELFLSSEVYLIENNLFKPITIISDTRKVSQDNKYLYSFDFEYYTLYNQKYHSKLTPVITGDFNKDFNNDFNS